MVGRNMVFPTALTAFYLQTNRVWLGNSVVLDVP